MKKSKIFKIIFIIVCIWIFILLNRNIVLAKEKYDYTTMSGGRYGDYLTSTQISYSNLITSTNVFCVAEGKHLGRVSSTYEGLSDLYFVRGFEEIKQNKAIYSTSKHIDGTLYYETTSYNTLRNEYYPFKIAYITAGGDDGKFGEGYSSHGNVGGDAKAYTPRQRALYSQWSEFVYYGASANYIKGTDEFRCNATRRHI